MDIKKKLDEVLGTQKTVIDSINKLDTEKAKLMNLALELEGQIKLLKELEKDA